MDEDKYVSGLTTRVGQRLIESITKPKNNRLPLIYIAFYAGLLVLVTGTEPAKLFFRKNIGKLALGIRSIFIAFIGLGIYAGVFFEMSMGTSTKYLYAQPRIIFIIGGIFYSILAITTLVMGLREYYSKAPKERDYRGDSIFFASKIQKGVPRQKIWIIYEPLIVFIIGLLLMIPHPFMGIPILVIAISFWINELYMVKFVPYRKNESALNTQTKTKQFQKSNNNSNASSRGFKRVDSEE
jgi:hypothetical protein